MCRFSTTLLKNFKRYLLRTLFDFLTYTKDEVRAGDSCLTTLGIMKKLGAIEIYIEICVLACTVPTLRQV